jgi:RNA polymerase primary sigma factor
MKTRTAGDPIRTYFRDISRYRLLKASEETALVSRIRKGDEKAREELINANLRIVISVARNYCGQGMDLADLINEGNSGLIRAVESFDESKNFRFVSYAIWWIREAILKALANQSRPMRLPVNVVGSIYRMSRTQEMLMQRLKREPRWDEVIEACRYSNDLARRLAGMDQRPLSIDCPCSESGDASYSETIPDPDAENADHVISHENFEQQVRGVLELLDSRELEIVTQYYGIGREARNTLEEIASKMNLTRERVRQIKYLALKRLRTEVKRDLLQECLPA